MSDLTGRQLAQAIEDASPQFGLAPTEVRLISHSENIVCGLTLPDGKRVAMYLYRPGYNTINELESQVQWMRALAAAGVSVPDVVATTAGPYTTSVAVGDQTRSVGVATWLDGEPLDEAMSNPATDRIAHYERIGAIAAQIRMHGAAWHRPAGFVRRSWDTDGLVGDRPLWGRFWDVASLTDEQRATFSRARDLLRSELQSVPRTNDRFGLIHADLHFGNLMASGDQIAVIDFDDAGFGWYAYELAVALHPILNQPWEPEARSALLEGYRSVCPFITHDENLIDTFTTIRCLMVVGWLAARPELASNEHAAVLADQATKAVHRYLDRH